jgi:hypothetical protein
VVDGCRRDGGQGVEWGHVGSVCALSRLS